MLSYYVFPLQSMNNLQLATMVQNVLLDILRGLNKVISLCGWLDLFLS